MLYAKHVQHERSEGMLPAKFQPGQSSATQRFPELVLSRSWPLAQLTCCQDDLAAGFTASWTRHFLTPLAPSPDRRGTAAAVRRGGGSVYFLELHHSR